jgi:sugar/nucleoside kinase (ribokinase family)
MREILREGGAEAVVATAGAGGSYLLTRDGSRTPGPTRATLPPGPVLDSDGAGDAYVSGFLYGRTTGTSMRVPVRARGHAPTPVRPRATRT